MNNTIDLINNNFDSTVKALQEEGCDPKGLVPSLDSEGPVPSWKEVGSHYKKWLQNNVDSMEKIARDVEVISKFSLGPKVDEKFQNGQWIEKMANAAFHNPVLFASINDIEIEGKNALIWATANDYRVKTLDSEHTQDVNVSERVWHKENDKWTDVNMNTSQQKSVFIEADPVEELLVCNAPEDLSLRVPLSNTASEFLQYALKNKLVSKVTGESYAAMMLRYNLSPKDYYKPLPSPRRAQKVDIELQKKAKQIGQELNKQMLQPKAQKSSSIAKIFSTKKNARGRN